MRRLPIFFVIDVSESMAGEPLRQLQTVMDQTIRTLRADPHALDSVFVSIIAFAGRVRTLVPLTELYAFFPPQLPLGAGTAIGAALDYTAAEITRQVITRNTNRHGDYKPIVYFMSDGTATDVVSSAVSRWQQTIGERNAKLIAIGIGKQADLSVFQPITDEIVRFEGRSDRDFSQFVQWMSQSITAQSRSLGAGKTVDKISLAKAEQYDVMKVIRDHIDACAVDDNFVILTGQCSQTKQPYLLKYRRLDHPIIEAPEVIYKFDYSCALDATYYEWSDTSFLNINTVNVQSLIGLADCPHCNNPYTVAPCQCGQLMCIAGESRVNCPSCGELQEFVYCDDNSGFDIPRSIG